MLKFRINLQTTLWLFIWGGMFTGFYTLKNPKLFSDPMALFQGMRAFLPHIVLYICLMWIFVARIKFPQFLNPLGLFFYYALTGIIISFLSPDVLTSIFWGFIYMAPVLLLWIVLSGDYAMENMRMILFANYIATFTIFMAMLYELFRTGKFGRMGLQYYDLPFGIGDMIANGAGRFALLVVIISVVRFVFTKNKIRYVFLPIIVVAGYIVMQTQSRTTLLGMGVASILFVLMLGLRWQFLVVGPAAAYVIWISGYERRAQQSFDKLFSITGRDTTWQDAINLIKESPFLGWGFHSDRIMLGGAHIHNSYVHAMIQSGILGLILFVAGITSIWFIILKKKILFKVREAQMNDHPFLIESIMIIGFLSSRSLFESTAAFFGIDLLILIPAIVFIYLWSRQDGKTEENP